MRSQRKRGASLRVRPLFCRFASVVINRRLLAVHHTAHRVADMHARAQSISPAKAFVKRPSNVTGRLHFGSRRRAPVSTGAAGLQDFCFSFWRSQRPTIYVRTSKTGNLCHVTHVTINTTCIYVRTSKTGKFHVARTHLLPVSGNMKDSRFRKDPHWTQ